MKVARAAGENMRSEPSFWWELVFITDPLLSFSSSIFVVITPAPKYFLFSKLWFWELTLV